MSNPRRGDPISCAVAKCNFIIHSFCVCTGDGAEWMERQRQRITFKQLLLLCMAAFFCVRLLVMCMIACYRPTVERRKLLRSGKKSVLFHGDGIHNIFFRSFVRRFFPCSICVYNDYSSLWMIFFSHSLSLSVRCRFATFLIINTFRSYTWIL